MAESLKHKTLKGTLWSSVERFSVQGIAFVVMIIMARILTPEDYGLVGMVTIFIAVSQSLVDSGFSQALIRKQDRTETDNSTVFFFNIAVGLFLYLILFLCAPLIARFYDQPVSAAIIAGAVGITMAYTGFGVWAIVWYQLANLAVNVGLLWVFSRWRPRLLYSWASFRELFSFGSKLALSGIIDTLYNNIYLIVIGKVFKASDLGYYTRSSQFAQFPSSNLSAIMQRVTFPVLCTIQDDDDRLRSVYRRFLRLSAFVVFPLMCGLAGVSYPFIRIILGEKWLFSAELLQIICLSMMWYPVHAINLNLLQVKGRSDLFLRLEIIKKCVGIAILCATVPLGLMAMCWGSLVASILCIVINTHYTGKLIQVGFLMQMRDLLPTLLYSLSMGALVLLTVNVIPGSDWLRLTSGILTGIIFFLIATTLTRSRDLHELRQLIKRNN